MTDLYKNPETEPQDALYESRLNDAFDWRGTRMDIAGPGGKATNIENNEKGILETGLFDAMATFKQADLGSSHDSFAQGIYSDTGDRYAD